MAAPCYDVGVAYGLQGGAVWGGLHVPARGEVGVVVHVKFAVQLGNELRD